MSQSSAYFSQILSSVFVNISIVKTTSSTSTSKSDYPFALLHFFEYILSVPLFPNRIPLKELPSLVARVPWDDLSSIPSFAEQETSIPPSMNILITQTSMSVRPHILANLLAFLAPRYTKLASRTLAGYLELYSELLDSIEPGVLEPIKESGAATGHAIVRVDSSDSEDAMDMDQEERKPITPPLDSRTMTRLNSLYSQSSLSGLLAASSRGPESRILFFR